MENPIYIMSGSLGEVDWVLGIFPTCYLFQLKWKRRLRFYLELYQTTAQHSAANTECWVVKGSQQMQLKNTNSDSTPEIC